MPEPNEAGPQRAPGLRRVLVAEDNASSLELVRDVAESDGWEVTWARDGVETLKELRRGRYDLLLLDLHMPALDGVGVMEDLKRRPLQHPPRIVVVTADILYGVREHLLELGADAMLGKPIDLAALVEVLRATAEIP